MERFGSAPHRRLFQRSPMRTIFSFVLAVLVTVFLWTTVASQTTNAQAATAKWNGASLTYNGKQFIEAGKAERNQFPGISEGAPYFMSGSTTTTGSANGPRDVFILYFSPGVDPPAATSAEHVKFRYTPSSKTYSNPQERQTVTLEGEHGAETTSCAVEGVGWIVCQLTSFLATGMDWVFEAISGFMEVQPLSTDRDSGLYLAWDMMRNIANIAFIIAFIIIVYAQVTGVYAGTYGIKKLLPRIIIAAILVNISYIICALAVDLSNILGYELQNIFIELRNQIAEAAGASWAVDTGSTKGMWANVTGFVLSGGTAGLALGVGAFSFIAASGGTIMGAIYLLLPALVGLLIALLVVLLILAARQAIITVAIVIAPLAFVAYLLPNTEKWFEKWRSLFMTMLIFFPAFSVLFGGAQLAGTLIIQNASSINVLILGMIVQVAPLVITPFLIKFSGSLLGRVAGLVNNPNKGLLDRTRKFSDQRAAFHRDRGISGMKNGRPNELRRKNFMRQASRRANNLGKNFEQKANNAKLAAENSYQGSRGYMRHHENAAHHETEKEALHAHHSAHIEQQRATAGSALNTRTRKLETEKQGLENAQTRTKLMTEQFRADQSSDLHMNSLRTENAKVQLDEATAHNARVMDEYKSGRLAKTGEADTLMREMKESTIRGSAEKQGQVSAQFEIQRAVATAMTDTSIARDALRNIAAGVGGDIGKTRARAQAVANLSKLEDDALKGSIDLLKSEAALKGTTFKNYSADIVSQVIQGKGQHIDQEQLKAALQLQAQEKNISLFEQARGSSTIDQSLVSEVISMNVGDFKAAGGFHLQNDPNLNVTVHGANFDREMAKARINTLASVSPENLAGLKAGWVENLVKNPQDFADSIAAAKQDGMSKEVLDAYMAVKKALNNPDVMAKLDNREGYVRDIERMLAESLNQNPTDDPRPKI